MEIKAILNQSGCCKHYRAAMTFRTPKGIVVTLESTNETPQQAKAAVLAAALELGFNVVLI